MKRRSPLWTICPSWKWISVSVPPTCARNSTRVDRRELAEQADPRVDVARERLAHRHLRGWHRRRGSLTASAIGEANPEDCRERYHRRAHHPGPGRGPRGGRTPGSFGVRPIADFVHRAVRPILNSPFAVLVGRMPCDRFINRHLRPARALRGLRRNANAAEFIEKLVPHRSRCPCCLSREGKMIIDI